MYKYLPALLLILCGFSANAKDNIYEHFKDVFENDSIEYSYISPEMMRQTHGTLSNNDIIVDTEQVSTVYIARALTSGLSAKIVSLVKKYVDKNDLTLLSSRRIPGGQTIILYGKKSKSTDKNNGYYNELIMLNQSGRGHPFTALTIITGDFALSKVWSDFDF